MYGAMPQNQAAIPGSSSLDPPGAADLEDGAPVMGTPIAHPPIAQPMPGRAFGGRGYQAVPGNEVPAEYDEYDDFDDEIQDQCMASCCSSCCPCCTGDPATAEWRGKACNAWFRSFSGLISVVGMLYFLVVMVWGLVNGGTNTLLAFDKHLLVFFGAKDTALVVQDLQVWRLFTSVLLQTGLLHLAWNVFLQMTLGWMLETGVGIIEGTEMLVRQPWGPAWTAGLFWISGLTGNLLGCVLNPADVSVGSSSAIIGMLGARIAGLVFTWNRLPSLTRRMEALQYTFWLLFIFLFGFGQKMVDNWGHVGGLSAGILAGSWFYLKTENASNECHSEPSTAANPSRYLPGLFLTILLAANLSLSILLFTYVPTHLSDNY